MNAAVATEPMRELLRRLRQVMAGRSPVATKLARAVDGIAAALRSDVASLYLRRNGVLELAATHGLAPEAIHVTRLGLGEGLVGTIAEERVPLALAEARRHPRFAYRPETGEERFHSFAGVPIIRRETAIGVLCVQHVQPRRYAEEELEALQTVAMVLAELIAGARLADERALERRAEGGAVRLEGLRIVDGLARGHAVFHEPQIRIERTVADDPAVERRRLDQGLDRLRAQIEHMMRQADFVGPGDHHEILETYRLFALDAGWVRRIQDAIASGLTAEAAIESVAQAQRARLMQAGSAYLRERVHDLDDVANRLIRLVAGQSDTAASGGLPERAILIARSLGPAELLEYDRDRLAGVALEEGSLTAHMTILARAMGVPVVGRLRGLRMAVREGDTVLLDGAAGALFVRPPATVARAFDQQARLRARRVAAYARLRDLPAETLDGVRVELYMNAGLRADLAAIELTQADGIGLFRTEFQFLVSATLPRKDRQIALYRDVLDAAGDRPVVFRTVDIGGDKTVPYLDSRDREEANPAMGWRAMRLALQRSGLLAAQARALLRAAEGRELRLMFPLVSAPWEYEAARAIVEEARTTLARRNIPQAAHVRYGAMLEVPALAEVLDELAGRLDFLSVGTNDLTQFLLAADRGHPRLADRYDWLDRGVLRWLARALAEARRLGLPITVCGEMGGRPLEALALVALGVRRLSITPAAIGPVKAMLRAVRLGPIADRVAHALDTPGGRVREALEAELAAQGIAEKA